MTNSSRSWVSRACAVLVVLTVFVVVGPPVGAIVFTVLVIALGYWRDVDLQGLAWVGVLATIYAAPLSYLIGVGPAAVAGLIIGTRKAIAGHVSLVFAVVTGLAVGAGLVVASGQPLVQSLADGMSVPPNAIIEIATSTVATVMCWSIVSAVALWRRGPAGPS